MACLVILLPLVWLVWPIRSKLPDFRLMTRRRILRETWKDRIQLILINPLREFFFFPQWSPDPAHGIHAGASPRLSMILILWSFILLVLFASPDFGQVHSQLVILAFLLPILVLILGFLGDVFQHGGLSDSLSRRLQKIRCGLRLWWIGGGLLCFCCFMFLPHWFDACHVWIAAIFFLFTDYHYILNGVDMLP
jgi:hypothetical protein